MQARRGETQTNISAEGATQRPRLMAVPRALPLGRLLIGGLGPPWWQGKLSREIFVSGQKQCIWVKIFLPPAPSSSTGLPVFKIVLGGTAALRALSGVGGGTSF